MLPLVQVVEGEPLCLYNMLLLCLPLVSEACAASYLLTGRVCEPCINLLEFKCFCFYVLRFKMQPVRKWGRGEVLGVTVASGQKNV